MITADQVGPPGAKHANDIWVDPNPPTDDVDHDFDSDWAARGMGPKRVRILGDIYELPSEPPAKLILMQARLKTADKSREVQTGEVLEMLRTILGDQADRLIERGLGITHLLDVMKYCMNKVKTQGEAAAPATGAPSPESTGSA